MRRAGGGPFDATSCPAAPPTSSAFTNPPSQPPLPPPPHATPAYPAQLLGVGAVSRAWAAKFFGPIATNGTITTASIDWASASPPISAAVASPQTVAADSRSLNVTADAATKEAAVTLTYAPGVSVFGFLITIPQPGAGMVTLTATLSDGTVLVYPIVAPVALPKVKIYAGVALFGPATVSTVEVKGTAMTAGAVLALSEFDAATATVAYPTWA